MKATWSDGDDSTSKEDDEVEEMANVCLIAIEENARDDELIKNFTRDELHDAFDELHDEFQKLNAKYLH